MMYQVYLFDDDDINSNLKATVGDSFEEVHQSVCPIALHKVPREIFPLLRGAALIQLVAMRRRDPLVVKTHNANIIGDGFSLHPGKLTKSSVYMVRDPRSIAVSYASHLGKTIDEIIEVMGNDYGLITNNTIPQFIFPWSYHVTSWSDKADLIIRYEDLIEDPGEHFKSCLKLWEEKIDNKKIDKAVERTTFDKLKAQEDEHGFFERAQGQFFRSGKVDEWKRVLSSEQANKIESMHKDVMEKYHYA